MKDKRSLHLKVLELCDCYATTDYLKEMSQLPGELDKEEGALKWVALSVLHGLTRMPRKSPSARGQDGQIKVVAKYRKSEAAFSR